jgi:hypothetical protein
VLNNFIKELSSHLCEQKWISDDEALEINAVISHWLQSPSFKYPFLTNSILKECHYYINKFLEKSITNEPINCVKESHSLYQPSFNFLFDNLPYPPPSYYKFTLTWSTGVQAA